MRILILWASLSDYMVACFKQLSKMPEVELLLAYQPANPNAPFRSFDLSFCCAHYKDISNDYKELEPIASKFNPEIILMASWNYRHYMKLARIYKRKGVPVISAFDNQWHGTIKQKIACRISSFYLKPAITNFLVPGDRQALFAKKLGYPEPIQGLYCANSSNFLSFKANLDTRQFVFVGRFVNDKSVKELVEAYKIYRNSISNPWKLKMIGEGPLKSICLNNEGIEVEDFAQPNELPSKFAESSCFILPSKHENWGLVIHEAALVGLPIICSSNCGASTWFLRDRQNGYLVTATKESILKSLIRIHHKTTDELKEMSDLSFSIGHYWTVEKWATNVYNLFKEYLNENSAPSCLTR